MSPCTHAGSRRTLVLKNALARFAASPDKTQPVSCVISVQLLMNKQLSRLGLELAATPGQEGPWHRHLAVPHREAV